MKRLVFGVERFIDFWFFFFVERNSSISATCLPFRRVTPSAQWPCLPFPVFSMCWYFPRARPYRKPPINAMWRRFCIWYPGISTTWHQARGTQKWINYILNLMIMRNCLFFFVQIVEIAGSRPPSPRQHESRCRETTRRQNSPERLGHNSGRPHRLHSRAARNAGRPGVAREFRSLCAFLARHWPHDRHRRQIQCVHGFVGDDTATYGVCTQQDISTGAGESIAGLLHDDVCGPQRPVELQSHSERTVIHLYAESDEQLFGLFVLWCWCSCVGHEFGWMPTQCRMHAVVRSIHAFLFDHSALLFAQFLGVPMLL